MPHHFKDPGAAPADESRERPEQAVTNNSSNKGKTVDEAMADTAGGSALHNKKKKKIRRDPKHTRLTSATNRAADKGDAER